MTYKIVPRVDDGTVDLLGKYADGKVDMLGNFASVEEAKDEIKNLKSPLSQSDSLNFLKQLNKSIQNI